jgi:hypothetical protein
MVQYLEELLHSKTKDGQSSILYAQWTYDKKIIPSALQAVSNLFPHYSLHDESHSNTIINNIVRVLGKENLVKLSSIDIWFILEAAYWHDLGMVVSGSELVDAIQSPGFLQFLSELISNGKHSLHEFAIKFDIVEGKLKPKDSFYNLELHDSIRYILAEFFRWRHADRSKEIISNPLRDIHLASPRGVIPQRIINLLGDICASHTKDFSDVLKLPFCEVGIDTEDAHPLFIACMLRIGDLLDLDNNRFSEVMLRTLTKIPADTLQHKAKHLSIKSFRVDRESIDILAQCEDYDTANIAQHWFNYLNDEISSQMVNWNSIVPSKEFGYLPTIGKLQVILKGYNQIDGKNKPQFSVDTDKALSLLQGAGIYDGAYQAIREIMQNAVDSTLIRIWLEHRDNKELDSPESDFFRDIVKNYPVSIKIVKGQVNGEYVSWSVEIADNGTGISANDFKFIMNTGSSSKNYERIDIIRTMPTWMRPSGTFGIGFQSIFMLTDVVGIETKSFFDEQARIVELNSPNSKKDGTVLVKNISSTHAYKPGVRLKFIHDAKAIPDRWSATIGSRAGDIAHNYDPFTHASLDIEMGKVLDEVIEFASKCCIPISLHFDGQEFGLTNEGNLFAYYDKETSLELNVFRTTNKRRDIKTYYKGQEVDNNFRGDLLFLSFEVNIHKDSAADVLTLNRNKIKPEYSTILFKDILQAGLRFLTSKYLEFDADDKIFISMFLNNYYDEAESAKFQLSKFSDWKKGEIIVNGNYMTMGDIMSQTNNFVIKYVKSLPNVEHADTYTLQDGTLTLETTNAVGKTLYSNFIIRKIALEYKGVKLAFDEESGMRQLFFFKEHIADGLISERDIEKIIISQSNFSSRATIPCPNGFLALQINDDAHAPYLGRYTVDYQIDLRFPKMVSPFIYAIKKRGSKSKVVEHRNNSLYDWVYENRADKKVTREEIIGAYDAFCSLVDLDKINKSL